MAWLGLAWPPHPFEFFEVGCGPNVGRQLLPSAIELSGLLHRDEHLPAFPQTHTTNAHTQLVKIQAHAVLTTPTLSAGLARGGSQCLRTTTRSRADGSQRIEVVLPTAASSSTHPHSLSPHRPLCRCTRPYEPGLVGGRYRSPGGWVATGVATASPCDKNHKMMRSERS